jgi:ABC-type multidrug transport system ATPase subunit/ABC-type transport system involved in multi-copper enzyme maturation permease subunit
MRTVATLQTPTEGTIRFGDIDVIAEPERLRRTLGYLPQDFGVYPRVSAYDMLDHMAVLKGIASTSDRKQTVETLLHQVNLWTVRKKALAGFSGGMRQRFGIAQALIGNPELIIVDEPTAGLDPEERNRFLNLLAEIGENVVVILSTHIVEDVSDLCPRMAVLAGGRIQLEGAPLDLIQATKGRIWMKVIERSELDGYKARFEVISTRLVRRPHGGHILADNDPGEGFEMSRAGWRMSTSPPSPSRAARPEESEPVNVSTPIAPAQTATQPRGKNPLDARQIAAFEFRYQFKNPVFWVTSGLFFLFSYGFVASDTIQIGGGGNIHENGPFSIVQTHVIFSIFFMFVTTAFVANVIVRDDDTGYGPIVRSTRITKFDYLIGRFIGAFGIAALAFVSIPLGIFIGSLMPWLDPGDARAEPDRRLSVRLFVFALPNILITSAILFALATVTRSMMTTYLGVVVLLVAWIVTNTTVRDRPELEGTMALAEPFGARAFGNASRYWTAAERNTVLPTLPGRCSPTAALDRHLDAVPGPGIQLVPLRR